jgi:hypothetical protein
MPYYHLHEMDDTWFLLDPEDNPVYLRGLNHAGDGTYMPHNLTARYGTREAWRRAVRDRHRAWGFNYLPPSIGPSEPEDRVVAPEPNGRGGLTWPTEIRRTPEWPADHYAALDYPFTAFLEVPKQYMAGEGLPDVFSREFREQVDRRCREFVAPLKDNPNLIGYHFCHNPPWHHSNPAFTQWLATIVAEGRPAKAVWARLMRRIYGTVARYRETYGIPIEDFADVEHLAFPLRGYVSERTAIRDRIAMMERVCEEWYKVYTETIRTYDPNHLILGDRNTIHLSPLPPYALAKMRPYIDVLSINVMGPASTIYACMEQVTRHWDGPIHLADTGAGIYNGSYPKSAYMTRDLAEFEALYRSHMEAGLTHPQIIGMGWCGYYETPASRSGVVDARTDDPLEEKVAVMQRWNAWMETAYTERYQRYRDRGEALD